MELTLNRTKLLPTSTLGTLNVDGIFFCYTLERPTSDSGGEAPYSIPSGEYVVAMRWSPRHNMNVPGIMDVPGRTDIEIHPANYPSQLLGCVAVGHTQDTDYVGESVLAFQALMEKIQNEKDLTITIS